MDFDYKKYSLENLENWMHDAMSSGEATPQEIYDAIIGVVKENYDHHKHHTSQAYELLSKLNGHPTEYNWLDRKENSAFVDASYYYKNVMPSATQRDMNKYCKAYDLDNKVCLDDTIEKLQNTILWPPETEKSNKPNLSCDKDDPSLECKGAWNDFWEENYYPEEHQQYTEEELNAMCDKAELDAQLEQIRKDGGYEWTPEVPKKKWILPVEEAKDMDTDKTEYFVSFPQDLLEAANLKEGDEINWVDQGDGSFKIVKVTKPLGPDEC